MDKKEYIIKKTMVKPYGKSKTAIVYIPCQFKGRLVKIVLCDSKEEKEYFEYLVKDEEMKEEFKQREKELEKHIKKLRELREKNKHHKIKEL